MEYRDDFVGDDLASYEDGRTSGPLVDWMREVLTQGVSQNGPLQDTTAVIHGRRVRLVLMSHPAE